MITTVEKGDMIKWHRVPLNKITSTSPAEYYLVTKYLSNNGINGGVLSVRADLYLVFVTGFVLTQRAKYQSGKRVFENVEMRIRTRASSDYVYNLNCHEIEIIKKKAK